MSQIILNGIELRELLEEIRTIIKEESPTFTSLPNSNPPLNIKEAAKILGIAQQTIYQNIERIPHRKKHGRLFFFENELLEYLNSGKS